MFGAVNKSKRKRKVGKKERRKKKPTASKGWKNIKKMREILK